MLTGKDTWDPSCHDISEYDVQFDILKKKLSEYMLKVNFWGFKDREGECQFRDTRDVGG